MAASVMQYNGGSSLRLTGGITKSRTKIVSRLELANPKKLKSARKMLFGPVNGEETRRIVENQLKKHVQDASTRWDFDFSTDQPIRSPQSKFVWERIPRPEDQDRLSPGAGGPVMTLSSAAHMRTIQAATLSPCSSTSSPNSSVLSSPSTSLCHSPDLDTSATTTTMMHSNGDLSSSKRMVQKKMTDFMKEKKRTNPVLATVAKKRDFAEISAATSSSSADELSHSSWTELPPAKRMRTGSAASSTSSVESS